MEARGGGLCRGLGSRGSAPAAAAPRGSSSAPIAACRVRSRGDQLGRRPPGRDLERSQRSGRSPAAGRLPAGFSGGIVPPRACQLTVRFAAKVPSLRRRPGACRTPHSRDDNENSPKWPRSDGKIAV